MNFHHEHHEVTWLRKSPEGIQIYKRQSRDWHIGRIILQKEFSESLDMNREKF